MEKLQCMVEVISCDIESHYYITEMCLIALLTALLCRVLGNKLPKTGSTVAMCQHMLYHIWHKIHQHAHILQNWVYAGSVVTGCRYYITEMCLIAFFTALLLPCIVQKNYTRPCRYKRLKSIVQYIHVSICCITSGIKYIHQHTISQNWLCYLFHWLRIKLR